MKRIIYICTLVILFSIMMIKIDVLAASLKTSTFRHFESTSSSGYSQCQETVEFNQVLTLNNVKVKLTQDDDNYTFKITADNTYDIKNNIGSNCINNGRIHMEPFLYKTVNFGGTMKIIESDCYPFASCNSGTMTDIYKLTINNTEIGYHRYEYRIYADGSTYTYENTSTDNGDKFFIPNETRFYLAAQTYNYKNRTIYPSGIPNNGDGVKLANDNTKVSESTRYLNGNIYVDSISTSFDSTLTIKKDYIDDYRYLCFGATFVANTAETYGTTTTSVTGYSLCTNTIDLKDYINCNHDWIAAVCDETAHTVKCSLCEWEKKENHSFEYAYDGIDNNVCICTKTKKVHYYYEINDDTVSTASEIYDVNENLDNTPFTKKTGYKFKWYEKYEYRFDVEDLKTLTDKTIPIKKELIATVSSLDIKAGNRSVYYKAVCEPIQYLFIYSNNSNVEEYISSELTYDKTISPQTFYYDKKSNLKKNIDYDYLTFLGWTLTEGTDKIDFHKEQEIVNYTAEDGKIYILYPVYDTVKYKVLYNTLNGYYDNFLQQDSKEYDFYTTNGLLIPHDLGADKEFSHYIDMNGNRFEELSEIRDFVKTDIENNKTVILFANIRKIVASENDNSDNPDDTGDVGGLEGTGNDEGAGGAGGKEGTEGTGSTGSTDGTGNKNDTDGENSGEDKNGEKKSEEEENDVERNDKENENDLNSGENKNNSNKNDGSSNENNGNDGNNNVGNSNNGNQGNTGDTNSSSGTRISGNESGGGGSGGGGKSITSNGSIVNGVLTDNNATLVDANSGTNVTQNAKEYLLNTKVTNEKETNTQKADTRKKKDEKTRQDENLDKEEVGFNENVYGPRLLFDPYNYEGNIIRATHGPWYFEQKYIDRILSEREKKQKELENSLKGEEKSFIKLFSPKVLAFMGVSFAIIIFVIVYEISTIKYYKKRRKLEMGSI